MSDRSVYSKKLTRLDTQIGEFKSTGRSIPGAQEILLESRSYVESQRSIVVISDTSTPQSVSVLSENDDVNLTAHDDYGSLAGPEAGVRNADMLIFELSSRLNQEKLSKFGVAVRLSKPDLFIGVVQTGEETLDPDAFASIFNANKDDLNRVLSETDLQFTTLSELNEVVAHQVSTELYDKMTKTSVLLDKRVSAALRQQELTLDATEAVLRSRRKYDFTLKEMGIRPRAGQTVSWEEIFSQKLSDAFKRASKNMFKTLQQYFKTYNGGIIYKDAVALVRKGKWNPRKRSDVERLKTELQTAILMRVQSLQEALITQHQAEVQDGVVKSSKDILKIISDSIGEVFRKIESDIHIDIETLERKRLEDSIDLDQLEMEIDARRALLSTFKRIRTVLMEAVSGAILAVLVGMQLTPEGFSLVLWGVGGAAGKGIFAYNDLKDTERSNFESLVENQIAGYLKDVESAMRENLDDYVSRARDHVQMSIEETIAWISSQLSEEMQMFDKLLAATADELQSEVSEQQDSISALNDLLADVQTLAEGAPAEDTSEEAPLEETPESDSEETPA